LHAVANFPDDQVLDFANGIIASNHDLVISFCFVTPEKLIVGVCGLAGQVGDADCDPICCCHLTGSTQSGQCRYGEAM
jgi:hypothetical protein